MLKIESYRKGILYSVFFNFIARGIAFLNAFAIAFYFGTNSTTDLYFYLLSFVTILTGFINGMDTYVLIPEAMRLRHQQSELSSMQFLNSFLYLYFGLGLLISLCIVINPTFFYHSISKFDYQRLVDNASLLYYSALLIVLILLTNLQTAIFASYRYFTMPMIVSAVNNIFSFFLIIWLHDRYGIKSGIMGMTAGYLLNFLFLIVYMRKKLNWNFGFSKIRLSKMTKKNLLFLQGSNIFPYLRNYVGIFLLSGLPVGTVASYNFGQQLSSIPESMVINQFGVVTGIKMNELNARRQYEDLNRIFLQASKVLLFITFPISGLIFLYSYEIVHFLYGRGKFDETAIIEVAGFLKYLGLLLPMSVLMNMAAKIFTAFQKINLAFYYNVFINLFLVGLIFVGTHFFGVIGYLVASVIGYLVVVFALYFLLKYNIKEITYLNVLVFFLRLVLINAAIVGLLWWAKQLTTDYSLHYIWKGVVGACLYVGLLYIVANVLNMKSFFRKKTYLD